MNTKIKYINTAYYNKQQAPVDIKGWFNTLQELKEYTIKNAQEIYRGMFAFVLEDYSIWRWVEWNPDTNPEDNNLVVLLNNGYTYEECYKTTPYSYSGKKFNWVKVKYLFEHITDWEPLWDYTGDNETCRTYFPIYSNTNKILLQPSRENCCPVGYFALYNNFGVYSKIECNYSEVRVYSNNTYSSIYSDNEIAVVKTNYSDNSIVLIQSNSDSNYINRRFYSEEVNYDLVSILDKDNMIIKVLKNNDDENNYFTIKLSYDNSYERYWGNRDSDVEFSFKSFSGNGVTENVGILRAKIISVNTEKLDDPSESYGTKYLHIGSGIKLFNLDFPDEQYGIYFGWSNGPWWNNLHGIVVEDTLRLKIYASAYLKFYDEICVNGILSNEFTIDNNGGRVIHELPTHSKSASCAFRYYSPVRFISLSGLYAEGRSLEMSGGIIIARDNFNTSGTLKGGDVIITGGKTRNNLLSAIDNSIGGNVYINGGWDKYGLFNNKKTGNVIIAYDDKNQTDNTGNKLLVGKTTTDRIEKIQVNDGAYIDYTSFNTAEVYGNNITFSNYDDLKYRTILVNVQDVNFDINFNIEPQDGQVIDFVILSDDPSKSMKVFVNDNVNNQQLQIDLTSDDLTPAQVGKLLKIIYRKTTTGSKFFVAK